MRLEDSDLAYFTKELGGLIETYVKDNERVHEAYKAQKERRPECHWFNALLDAICLVKDDKF